MHSAIVQDMNQKNSEDLGELRCWPIDSACSPNVEVPIWNPQALHELEAIGGEPLVAKVVRQCVMDAEGHLQHIVRHGSDSAWRESAHALHGIALNVGAIRLSYLLETTLADREAPAEQWTALLAKEFDDLRDVLVSRFP